MISTRRRSTAMPAAPMVTVLDAGRCIGFLRRGPVGAEAFNTDKKSIGTFESDRAAAVALWRRAHGQLLDIIAAMDAVAS